MVGKKNRPHITSQMIETIKDMWTRQPRLSQVEIASELNLHPATVSRVLNDKTFIGSRKKREAKPKSKIEFVTKQDFDRLESIVNQLSDSLEAIQHEIAEFEPIIREFKTILEQYG